MTGLQDSASPNVVKASLNGMRDLMVSISDKEEVIQLQALIGPVLAATTNLLNAGDEDLVTERWASDSLLCERQVPPGSATKH